MLRWCVDAIASGARITAVRALEGGTSSAVHAVDVRDARDALHELVLRRYVRPGWLAEEPDVARHEAAALALAAGSVLPVPRLVGVDADGVHAGAPALLMTRLTGGVDWSPHAIEPYLLALARALPAIHATPVGSDAPLPAYAPYGLAARAAPSWSARPQLWERAFQRFDGPAPSGERCFIHRDFHPGNVLWSGGRVSGVVDWPNASLGSPDADVGHCRWNLAGAFGQPVADRFLALHRGASGRGEYDTYWDVVAALGGNDPGDWTPVDEAFLAAALSGGR